MSKASWIQFAAATVKFIFSLSPSPFEIVKQLVEKCFEVLLEKDLVQKESDFEIVVNSLDQVNEELVRRFLSLIGQVAVNIVSFLEINVMNEVKSRKMRREEEEEARRASRRANAGRSQPLDSRRLNTPALDKSRSSQLTEVSMAKSTAAKSRRGGTNRNSTASTALSETVSHI